MPRGGHPPRTARDGRHRYAFSLTSTEPSRFPPKRQISPGGVAFNVFAPGLVASAARPSGLGSGAGDADLGRVESWSPRRGPR